MRLVNTDNHSLKSHKVYAGIPQPMPIYHSTEELKLNEDMNNISIINKPDLYLKYRYTVFPNNKYLMKIPNTFIATGEKFVPQSFTKEGFLIYETVGMNVRETDNCYIKLYYLMYIPGNSRMIVTSTGMWNVATGTRLSAGVPPKISYERDWNLKLNRDTRQKSVDKIKHGLKTSTKLSVMDYKFISRLLNPLTGDFFLNPMLSAKQSYRPNANPLSKDDLMEILASERVQRLILKELKIVMPELARAIQENTNPQAIATMLQKIADDTINKDESTVEDKLLSVQAILNAGYPDDAVNLNPPKEMIGAGFPLGMGIQGGTPQQSLINSYEPSKVIGGEDISKPKAEPEPMSDIDRDKQFVERSEDVGAISDYTFDNNIQIET